MGEVDPRDDSKNRFIVMHYRFDPARRERLEASQRRAAALHLDIGVGNERIEPDVLRYRRSPWTTAYDKQRMQMRAASQY